MTYDGAGSDGHVAQRVLPVVAESWSLDGDDLQSHLQPAIRENLQSEKLSVIGPDEFWEKVGGSVAQSWTCSSIYNLNKENENLHARQYNWLQKKPSVQKKVLLLGVCVSVQDDGDGDCLQNQRVQ